MESEFMNYLTFREVMKKFPAFSVREIEKQFPRFDSRRLVEWQEKGYIKKLRNRYYYFSDQDESGPFLFYAANELYPPSYISLESALSVYNFIPEGVFQITSCTTRKTNSFQTPAGHFAYRHLKPPLFFGYQLQSWGNHRFAIAEPEKTLIDYLYLHHEVEEPDDIESLRWNSVEIRDQVSMQTLTTYENYIGSSALSRRLELLKTFIDAATA
jgi:predicted transcriptional regulator of viral defense system